ncbi:MAG: hypothetical protein ABIL02_05405 [candidate division WOR-3 bacterium]
MVIDRISKNGQNCANQGLAYVSAISDEISEVLKKGSFGFVNRRSAVRICSLAIIFHKIVTATLDLTGLNICLS